MILVVRHISTGVLMRIALAIFVKLPVEICQFTRITMTRLNVSLKLQNFSQQNPNEETTFGDHFSWFILHNNSWENNLLVMRRYKGLVFDAILHQNRELFAPKWDLFNDLFWEHWMTLSSWKKKLLVSIFTITVTRMNF